MSTRTGAIRRLQTSVDLACDDRCRCPKVLHGLGASSATFDSVAGLADTGRVADRAVGSTTQRRIPYSPKNRQRHCVVGVTAGGRVDCAVDEDHADRLHSPSREGRVSAIRTGSPLHRTESERRRTFQPALRSACDFGGGEDATAAPTTAPESPPSPKVDRCV